MSGDQIKPIKISPELLTIGPRSAKNRTVKRTQNNNNIKPNLLKRELLAKIKNYRTNKLRHNEVTTSRVAPSISPSNTTPDSISHTAPNSISNQTVSKIEHTKPPVSVVREQKTPSYNIDGDDDFSQSINFLKSLSDKKKRDKEKNQDNFPIVLSNDSTPSLIRDPPAYSCLKNSTLPTFRELHNKTLKKTVDNPSHSNHDIISGDMKINQSLDKPNKLNRAVTFKYNLGKKNRYVSVLIKNAETRKKVSSEHTRLKETRLSDMKSYLKRHNLLKSGSHARPDVINKLYEQCLLAGDIRNANKNNLIHNYLAE
jgi:hypothetical protein